MNHGAHGEHGAHGGEPLDVASTCAALIGAGLKVHRTLGPGLLESTYESCLMRELELRGVDAKRQVAIPLVYEGLRLETAYRLDILVENAIILEIKAVEGLGRLHESQLLTYLRLSGLRIGYLINFNVSLFKNGLKRMVL